MGCRLPFLVVVGVIRGISVTLSTIPLRIGREITRGTKYLTSEVIEIFGLLIRAVIFWDIFGPAQSFWRPG